jgi:putative molybdopterin biosynthesis protein
MDLGLEIRWCYQGRKNEEIDPVLFTLLRLIREQGSLRSAAESSGISYRHAWGLIHHWTSCISIPIVNMERGRGARLTDIGEKLLLAEQMINNLLAPVLDDITRDLNNELDQLVGEKSSPVKIRIEASHGFAITYFQTLCSESESIDVDLHLRGSLESLRSLASSRCDIAGFHFPHGEISTRLAPYYLQWLNPEKHMLLHISTREQGLIIQKNNPHKITGLKSLTRRSVRFINRQPESGTRTIFDELLKQENIDKSRINGYKDEEFTHLAVAAMVASGTVDAGFGIKAVTSKFKLNFIPIIRETYAFAINKTLPKTAVTEIQKILCSRKFKNKINKLPGYNIRNSGKEISYEDLFRHN